MDFLLYCKNVLHKIKGGLLVFMNPSQILPLLAINYPRFFPDVLFLKIIYHHAHGEKLNLRNPQTFNEKLQWLKLFDRNPEYTKMVDKYEVKDYVASIIGKQYIIPTLAVYNSVEEIDFDSLPNQFVLKCTHDSGGVIICKDKSTLNQQEAIEKLRESLNQNFFFQNREWPYKNVKPRIIAEKYMEDVDGELKDYKVFTFNGEPKLIEIDYNRFKGHLRNLYNVNWKRLDVTIQYPTDNNRDFVKPMVLDQLLDLSRKLSKGIPHVRTDFYIINDKIYFGELTFYHGSGLEKMAPKSFDLEMGNWLKLPSIN